MRRPTRHASALFAVVLAVGSCAFPSRAADALDYDSFVSLVAEAEILELLSSADDEQDLLDRLTETGRSAFDRGAVARAEIIFRAIVKRDPSRQDAVQWLAKSLLLQGKTTEATDVLLDATTRFPDSARISMLLGRVYLEQGDRCAAQYWFEETYWLEPCLPDIGYYIGSSYLERQRPLTALQILRGAPTSRPELDWAQDLAIGAAFGQLGLQQEASSYFQSVVAAAGTELAGQAAQLQDQLDDMVFGREYLRGSIKITERYDTNPAVIPEANTFGAPLGSSASAGNQYVATFSYDLLRDYNLDVTTGYTLLHTSNYEIHGFDLLDNAVYLSAARRDMWRGRPLQSVIRLDYDYLTVGSNSFLQRLQATPSWTITQSDFGATTLLMRYTLYDFLGQGSANGTPFDQDADNLMVGMIRQHRLCRSDAILFGGYQYDHTFSEGSNFDYDGHKLLVGLRTELPWHGIKLAVTGNVYFRNYSHPNSIAGIARNDEEFFLQTQLLYPLTDEWRLTFEWNFDRNNSNLRFNDYRRDVLDIGVQYAFPSSYASRSL